jgi:type I restriction enzyme M protein
VTTGLDLARSAGAQFDLLTDPRLRTADRLEFTGLAAALLLLRWSEHEEAERPPEAALPASLRWAAWSGLRGPALGEFLDGHLLPWLRRGGRRLSWLDKALEGHSRVGGSAVGGLLEGLSLIDFGSPGGRRHARAELETLVDWAVSDPQKGVPWYTPAPVVELMVNLAGPRPGDRIYDPCFGLGGLLAASARRITAAAEALPAPAWADLRQNSIFGIEIEPVPYAIGLARVVLSGITQPGMERGDALERESAGLLTAEQFDVVLANPPWGALYDVVPELADDPPPALAIFKQRYGHFRFQSSAKENLFLQHAVGALRPGGRAVISVPEGLLLRGGADRQLRQWLLREFRVEGVISLPPGAFAPCTAIKANLLLLRRERAGRPVRFVTVGHLAGTSGTPRGGSEEVLSVARRFREGQPGPQLWEMAVEDIERRGDELVAKHNKAVSLEQLLDDLEQTVSTLPIQRLEEVARISPGINISREQTSKSRPHGRRVPIIRAADIGEGKIRPPQLFFLGGGEQTLEHAQLKPGDVVIPAVTVGGRAGLVGEEQKGAVAASTVWVIRPREGLSGEYLATLIRSESYQSWLAANASSVASARRLPMETLERLPVPVPALTLQGSVVRACQSEEGLDPIASLIRALTSSRDANRKRLESLPLVRIFSRLPQEAEGSPEELLLLDQVAGAARETLNQVGHQQDLGLDSGQVPWLIEFCRGAAVLRGVAQIPPGAARLAVLETACAEMGRSYLLHQITSRGEVSSLLFRAHRVLEMVSAQSGKLLSGTRLEPILDTDRVRAGQGEEVVVRLLNRSLLPLRNLGVTAHPLTGQAEAAFLPEGGELQVRVDVGTQKPGAVPFTLNWQGERLDGARVSGQIPLSIKVRPAMQPDDVADLGTSPYVVGSPVESRDLFIGRQGLIDQVRRQLPTDHRANVILLEGNRRTGKTSILKHLQLPGVLPGWYPVYCSFQEREGVAGSAGLPTAEVFRLMARSIGWQLESAGVRAWFPDVPPADQERPGGRRGTPGRRDRPGPGETGPRRPLRASGGREEAPARRHGRLRPRAVGHRPHAQPLGRAEGAGG